MVWCVADTLYAPCEVQFSAFVLLPVAVTKQHYGFKAATANSRSTTPLVVTVADGQRGERHGQDFLFMGCMC